MFTLHLKFMETSQMLNRDGSHLHEERAAAITVTLLICFPSRIKACPGNKSVAVISNDDLPTEGNSISRPVNEFSALEAFMLQIALFSGWWHCLRVVGIETKRWFIMANRGWGNWRKLVWWNGNVYKQIRISCTVLTISLGL